jgi:hypothetical protein
MHSEWIMFAELWLARYCSESDDSARERTRAVPLAVPCALDVVAAGPISQSCWHSF